MLVVSFFLALAYPGLRGYFTGDDLMNLQQMHGYFTTPLARAALDVLNPFSAAYRPMGGIFYRAIYAAAGFHPLPLRCACFVLLACNLGIAWRVLWLLSGSRDAALLGALLLSYHAEMYGLYFNTGTVYDILCFTFFGAALLLYISCRGAGTFGWRAWLGLLTLDLFALQSKEMAWTLPAILLLYEGVYGARKNWRLSTLGPALATGIVTFAPLFARIVGPAGLTSSPLYRPNLSPAYLLGNYARYWGVSFYLPGGFSVPGMAAMWFVMAAAALYLQSRAMWFGLIFWIVTVAPVTVISPREGYVLYLPLLGLALYWSALAIRLSERVTANRLAAKFCLLGLAAAGIVAAHARLGFLSAATIRQQDETRSLVTQLRRAHATLPHNAHVLFVEDPFGEEWFLGFLFRLMYDDGTLRVDTAAFPVHSQRYEYVFRYAGGRLEELPPRLAPCTPQLLTGRLTDDASPLLCWQGDWVSQQFDRASGGTLTYIAEAGATVAFEFTGESLAFVCTKAMNRGMAEMIIDGRSRGVIDLYSRETEWQAAFPFDGLPGGRHEAVLRVLGRHNAAASDSVVDVDALRLRSAAR